MESCGLKVSRKTTEYLVLGDEERKYTSCVDARRICNKSNGTQVHGIYGAVHQDGGSGKEKRIQAGWNGWRKMTGVVESLCVKCIRPWSGGLK